MYLYDWKKLLLCAVLEFAALTGAPLRPRDIELVLMPKTSVSEHAEDHESTPEI